MYVRDLSLELDSLLNWEEGGPPFSWAIPELLLPPGFPCLPYPGRLGPMIGVPVPKVVSASVYPYPISVWALWVWPPWSGLQMLGFIVHIYCLGGDTYRGFKDDNKRMRMYSLTALLSIVMSQNLLLPMGSKDPIGASRIIKLFAWLCLLHLLLTLLLIPIYQQL